MPQQAEASEAARVQIGAVSSMEGSRAMISQAMV
jgi:hypothetical protein